MRALAKARADKGVSQRELACELGVSRQSYIFWEKDPVRRMRVSDFVKACEYVGARPEDIFLAERESNTKH